MRGNEPQGVLEAVFANTGQWAHGDGNRIAVGQEGAKVEVMDGGPAPCVAVPDDGRLRLNFPDVRVRDQLIEHARELGAPMIPAFTHMILA